MTETTERITLEGRLRVCPVVREHDWEIAATSLRMVFEGLAERCVRITIEELPERFDDAD